MKHLFLFLFIITIFFACKKSNQASLNNSKWQTYFKYETFTFYAEKELVLNKDKTCYELGETDTTYGEWSSSDEEIKINLDNKTIIRAMIISKDSLSGYRLNEAGVSGEWLAKRK